MDQFQSSPTSFHTVQEFQSPSSFPSISDFEGFTDDDAGIPSMPTTALTPPIAPTQSTTTLAPPPIHNPDTSLRTFLSSKDALLYCQTWARDHGYAIRKSRTKTRRKENAIYKIYFECECAGKKRASKIPDQFRVRKGQASKACGCPFKGSVTEKDRSWSIQIGDPDHANHLPLLQPGDSAIHRRVARTAHPELRQQVQNNLQTRIQPKKTMDDWLLKDPTTPVILKDVYNLFASAKKEQDGGLPPIQALFSKLQKNDRFLYKYSTDQYNAIWNILFFNASSLDLLRRFPSTIVLDSTYKTNHHNMYLLDLVGITATNSSFIIGQAFVSAETAKDYIWVLEWLYNYYSKAQLPSPKSITTDKGGGLMKAVEFIFPEVPHLLCIWHVNNDVEAYCRKL